MKPLLDLTGQRFGRLTAQRAVSSNPRRWLVRCDCGNERSVVQSELRSGRTKSCGCSRQKHGHCAASRSPTWRTWESMIGRCCRETHSAYFRYGARGITVCSRWRDFENFLADMGERPVGTSLDRIDGSGNYEPRNCRWASVQVQSFNRRTTHTVNLGGEEMCLKTAARVLGIHARTLSRRLNDHGDPTRPHHRERAFA